VELSNWVRNLRRKKIRGTLSSEKIAKLEELGFVWRKERKDSWEEHFLQLIEFNERFAALTVPPIRAPTYSRIALVFVQVWSLSGLTELEGKRQAGAVGSGT
jgi:hypothetical protein